MKIAVLSDIHANYAALKVALEDVDRWRPDAVIFLGDVVNRGPKPLDCLRMTQSFSQMYPCYFVLGNHEEYVLEQANGKYAPESPAGMVHQASRWTMEQLGAEISLLSQFALFVDIPVPHGGIARFVHGSMRGLRDGIYADTAEVELSARLGLEGLESHHPFSLFCVGHTHRAFISRFWQIQVVNAGSVGLPFDGDQRLGYARLQWQKTKWKAEIVRLAYDVREAEMDFYTSGYLKGAGPLAQLVLIELRTASSQLYQWARDYQEQVLSGKMHIRQSVIDHIYQLHRNHCP